MRPELLEHIECPFCRGRDFELQVTEENGHEVREGKIGCGGCHHELTIRKGIVDLLPEPSAVIRNEQKGWSQMLGHPPDEEMTRNMLLLPYHPGAIWETTARNFDHALDLVDLEGKRVLDVGAGRCWSSWRMALAGAEYVLALDILTEKFIGLETADIYFENDGVYFDRILGDMNRLPVPAESFDVAFMTGTLHHSSSPGLVMREVARILKPGGVAVVVNEPVQGLLKTDALKDSPEIAHGINENVYTIWTYLTRTLRAGLRPWFFFPRSIEWRLSINAEEDVRLELGDWGYNLVANLWRRKWTRRVFLETRPLLALVYLVANMPLVMVAFKR